MTQQILAVSAALLLRGQQFLIAQRLPDVANGSLWEIPGGKLEFGESPEESLRRELQEELGIDATVGQIYGVFSQVVSPALQVLLIVYACLSGPDQPRALECQDFRWVSPGEALEYPLAPLDRQIVERLLVDYPKA